MGCEGGLRRRRQQGQQFCRYSPDLGGRKTSPPMPRGTFAKTGSTAFWHSFLKQPEVLGGFFPNAPPPPAGGTASRVAGVRSLGTTSRRPIQVAREREEGQRATESRGAP